MYSFGRGYKTFEAVTANWTEQRFIPSVFDRGVMLKKLLFNAKNLLQKESWNFGQMLWKHLNEALLDKLHHQIQTA